jgi:hypothetical protein
MGPPGYFDNLQNYTNVLGMDQAANHTFNHMDSESFNELLSIEKKNETINDNHDSEVNLPNINTIEKLENDNLKEGGESILVPEVKIGGKPPTEIKIYERSPAPPPFKMLLEQNRSPRSPRAKAAFLKSGK